MGEVSATAIRQVRIVIPGEPVGWKTPEIKTRVIITPNRSAGASGGRGSRTLCTSCGAKGFIDVSHYTKDVVAAWKAKAIPLMHQAAHQARNRYGISQTTPLFDGPVGIKGRALFRRPKSAHRKTSFLPRIWAVTKPDDCNIRKLIEDCGTSARWWNDDNQTCHALSQTMYGTVRPHACRSGHVCEDAEAPWVEFLAYELGICPQPS